MFQEITQQDSMVLSKLIVNRVFTDGIVALL